MIFPIGDDNVEGGFRPIFSYTFLAINIVVFALTYSNLQHVANEFGANPCSILQGRELVDLLTSMFLHGGLMHLIGNMLFLWIFADNIESTIGNFRFVMFYILGGLIAAATHILLDAGNCATSAGIPMVGASGAIAAVMGAYLVMFPKSRIKMLFIIKVFYLPAFLFLGFWIANQLFSVFGESVFQPKGDSGGVAFWAHIGGFAFGVFAGFFFKNRYPKIEEVRSNPKEYRTIKIKPKRYNNRF